MLLNFQSRVLYTGPPLSISHILLVNKASPHGKLRIVVHTRMWYMYMPYVPNPESAQKILRTQ